MRSKALATALLACTSLTHAQEIIELGPTWANAVNDDGSVVVGIFYGPEGNHALRWTPQTGPLDLGPLFPHGFALAQGVSGDGSIIVGYGGDDKDWDTQRAFR